MSVGGSEVQHVADSGFGYCWDLFDTNGRKTTLMRNDVASIPQVDLLGHGGNSQ